MKISKTSSKIGMSLIEVIIYVCLLSILLSTFIQFVYIHQDRNYELLHEINDAYSE